MITLPLDTAVVELQRDEVTGVAVDERQCWRGKPKLDKPLIRPRTTLLLSVKLSV
jgi:hypothetical protein